MNENISAPGITGLVAVSYYDSNHRVQRTVGHVLSVGQFDETTNLPELTIAFPDPDSWASLSKPNWHAGYVRRTGVKHISHPDVASGKASIAWGGRLVVEDGPSIPTPENTSFNPVFSRATIAPALRPSFDQAAAVQSGRVQETAGQSPLLSGVDEPSPAEPVEPTQETPIVTEPAQETAGLPSANDLDTVAAEKAIIARLARAQLDPAVDAAAPTEPPATA